MTNKLFILVLLFLLLHLSSASAVGHPDIVSDTCKQCCARSPNVNYTLCVSSLSSVPGSRRADLRGLAVISLKLAAANAKLAQSQVKKLLKTKPKPKDPYVKSCLSTCLEVYTDAISSLRDSATAIKAGNYENANIWISSAVGASSTCDDSFTEGSIVSPLVEENKCFFQLAVTALGITTLLH